MITNNLIKIIINNLFMKNFILIYFIKFIFDDSGEKQRRRPKAGEATGFSVKIVLTIFDVISFVRKSTYAHSDWCTLESTPISDVLSNGFAKLPILGSVCTETRGPNVGLVRNFVRVFVWCCPCVCSCIFVAFSILFVGQFCISFLISATVMLCVCLCHLQQVCS